MTDDEIEAGLVEMIEQEKAFIVRWMKTDDDPEPNPLLAKDLNGRLLLGDLYSSLAMLRAARLFSAAGAQSTPSIVKGLETRYVATEDRVMVSDKCNCPRGSSGLHYSTCPDN